MAPPKQSPESASLLGAQIPCVSSTNDYSTPPQGRVAEPEQTSACPRPRMQGAGQMSGCLLLPCSAAPEPLSSAGFRVL